MDCFIKVCWYATWFLILVHVAAGQQTNNNGGNMGFMPGSSPSSPTKALAQCQNKARSRPFNVSYSGTYAMHIHNWCSKYNDILPCLDRTLPPSNDITDWFLKLILDQSRAARMSRSMCVRFPFISNLTCADEGMNNARKCMEWSTKTSVGQFYSQFRPGQPFTQNNKRMASIYACITTVATAGCLHKELTACSSPQRKLIYDFFIMFSGKCREVAGLPEPTSTSTTISPPAGDTKLNTDNQQTEQTTQSPDVIQIEDTKLNTALQSELDNKDTAQTQQNGTDPQSTRTESTTSGNTAVNRHQSEGGYNGQPSPFHISNWWTLLLLSVVTIVL